MAQNWKNIMNTTDRTYKYDAQDVKENKLWAALSYVVILFILPLCVNGGKSGYAKFHANQGFLLFLTELVCLLANAALGWIPVLGWIIRVLLILIVILFIIQGIINAVCGKARELPFIGNLLHVFDR